MRRFPLLVLAGLSGCLVPASPEWDAVSSEVLHVQLDPLFAAIDKGDVEALLGTMDDAIIVYDVDERGVPLVAHDKFEARKLLDQLAAQRRVTGGTLVSHIQAATCHATTAMGFCSIEYAQTVTHAPDVTSTVHARATLVARHLEGSWRWVQWTVAPTGRTEAVADVPAIAAPPAGLTVEAVEAPKP